MNKGKEIELASLDEAVGHFERIESVSFDDDGAALAQYAASEAEAVDVSDIVPTKLKKRTVRSIPKPAAPSIKKKADAAGAVANQNQESKSKWRAIRKRPAVEVSSVLVTTTTNSHAIVPQPDIYPESTLYDIFPPAGSCRSTFVLGRRPAL